MTGPVNMAFFVFMGLLALADIISCLRHGKLDFRGAIVSTGVLGTFVGVFLGLQDFDTNNLRDSVPGLLAGMKTAFATSIVGMGLSILLTVFFHSRDNDDGSGGLVAEAIEREAKLTRTLISEGFSSTQERLDEAVSAIGQNASDQLLTSLETVVNSFNAELNKQFGENFKELNVAVGRLLVWQENYRDLVDADRALMGDVERMHAQVMTVLQQAGQGQAQVQTSLDNLTPLLGAMADESAALVAQRELLQRSGAALTESLSALQDISQNVAQSMAQQTATVGRLSSELSRQLPTAIGQLEESLTGLTTRFSKDYEGFLKHYRSLIDQQ